MRHGGDIYRNKVDMDFSINVNPLGIPSSVKEALHDAVERCALYPDPEAEGLKRVVSAMLRTKEEYLVFGNGASELFLAVFHALKPARTVIPIPSFYGYEYAAHAQDGETVFYQMKEDDEFALDEKIMSVLSEDVDLLFLANPNNPVGNLVSPVVMEKILCYCKRKGIYVVLDECFIEFCGQKFSMIQNVKEYPNLIIIRAFTKIFSIPGVRLGYLVSSNIKLLEKIKSQLPEWNLSSFAQAAGIACVEEKGFLEKSREYVREERAFLVNGLEKWGIKVFGGEADFILLYTRVPLYERLLKEGILIRDCSNFRGLSKGYYRIAVKSREENKKLLEMIGEIL